MLNVDNNFQKLVDFIASWSLAIYNAICHFLSRTSKQQVYKEINKKNLDNKNESSAIFEES